ncbi:hypothetical protein [Oceanobacillus sp. AG]|uniref:hypothetical protein n=1 Tax=Oceanobacillus sp. AG TaxID=2681969 RepID=UPI0012EB5CB8|nr:hypothetical protein [Oceanobacillus sp. AG]
MGVKQSDRCIAGLSHDIFQERINTENLTIETVAEKIALKSEIQLITDKRGKFKRKLDRLKIQLSHIRWF